MGRIGIDQTQGLQDIISTMEFEFRLGQIPGWNRSTRDLGIKCQQVSYPGMGNEAFEVALHGYSMWFRGRKTYPRQLSATYVEDRNMETTKIFESWSEFTVGTLSGTSQGYKNQYAIKRAELITYDPTGEPIGALVLRNLFPQDKPDVQYDGSSSQAYLVNITFVYDYILPANITLR